MKLELTHKKRNVEQQGSQQSSRGDVPDVRGRRRRDPHVGALVAAPGVQDLLARGKLKAFDESMWGKIFWGPGLGRVFGSVCGRVAVWVPDAPVRAGCALVRVQRMNE